jgi:hypothetical protein
MENRFERGSQLARLIVLQISSALSRWPPLKEKKFIPSGGWEGDPSPPKGEFFISRRDRRFEGRSERKRVRSPDCPYLIKPFRFGAIP